MKNAVSTPKHLYRFFKKKDYMRQFLQGSIRFGSLDEYRQIEDEKRRDVDEGRARGKYKTDKIRYLKISNETGKVIEGGYKPGDIFITGDSPNKYFIVAFSDERANLKMLSEKFESKYVVKIKNPRKLLDLLNRNCNFSWKVGRVILEQVKYDKDNYITMEGDNPHLPFGYHFAQKPESFVDECEWRIVITGIAIEEVNEKYPTVETGSIEDISSVVDL